MNTPITAQQIFDTVVRHAWAMPRQSKIKGDTCAYRGSEGNACFVGVFLSDEVATEGDKSNQNTVGDLEKRGLLPSELVPHVTLLRGLQSVHDSRCNWENQGKGPALRDKMSADFRRIATRHNLSTLVLDDPRPLPESLTSLLRTPAPTPTHEPAL